MRSTVWPVPPQDELSHCHDSDPAAAAIAETLPARRWYPSCILLANGAVLVGGGEADDGGLYPPSGPYPGLFVEITSDTYEVWNTDSSQYETHVKNLVSTQIFDGATYETATPGIPNAGLYVYPRMHLLRSGETFLGSMEIQAATLWHDNTTDPSWGPEKWYPRDESLFANWYGNSVLYPHSNDAYADVVMIIGGSNRGVLDLPDPPPTEHPEPPPPLGPSDIVQLCKASATVPGCIGGHNPGYTWTGQLPFPSPPGPGIPCDGLMPLNHARVFQNSVLLPDKSVLVVGGIAGEPVQQFERWNGAGWEVLETNSGSHRGYHFVAMLMPSAKVLIAAGNARCADYQIYVPPYLDGVDVPRPVWGGVAPALEPTDYGVSHTASFTMSGPGSTVDKVVLMRPASITHHFDSDQRYVELEATVGEGTVTFEMPESRPGDAGSGSFGRVTAPPGFYMCFLVSTAGVPSVARWVELMDS